MAKRSDSFRADGGALAAELPEGDGWQYEPKWDGFRCLAFRDGDGSSCRSKSGKPLARYFPEVVEMLRALQARRFVLDGELIIPVGDALSFDALQLRLHPAESRVRKLAAETPAELIAVRPASSSTAKTACRRAARASGARRSRHSSRDACRRAGLAALAR